MRIDWRARNGLDSLKLSRRRHVEPLSEKIKNAERQQDDEKNRRRVRNNKNDRNNAKKRVEKRSKRHGNRLVDHVDVLGETIDDATERRRVEERHWRAKNVGEKTPVETSCGDERAENDSEGRKQDGERLTDAEYRVDAQIVADRWNNGGVRLVLASARDFVVAPLGEPDVRADRRAVLEKIEDDYNRGDGPRQRAEIDGVYAEFHVADLRLFLFYRRLASFFGFWRVGRLLLRRWVFVVGFFFDVIVAVVVRLIVGIGTVRSGVDAKKAGEIAVVCLKLVVRANLEMTSKN